MRAAAFLVLLCAAACGLDSDAFGRSCAADVDCGRGYVCDDQERFCVHASAGEGEGEGDGEGEGEGEGEGPPHHGHGDGD